MMNEIGNATRRVIYGEKEQEISSGQVEFEKSIRHPSRDVE